MAKNWGIIDDIRSFLEVDEMQFESVEKVEELTIEGGFLRLLMDVIVEGGLECVRKFYCRTKKRQLPNSTPLAPSPHAPSNGGTAGLAVSSLNTKSAFLIVILLKPQQYQQEEQRVARARYVSLIEAVSWTPHSWTSLSSSRIR